MNTVLDRESRSVRVMIIDNDATSLATRSQLFAGFGCLVIGATSKRDAVRELEASPVPDLIVTDLHMPEGDDDSADRDTTGLLVCDHVKARYPTVPVACYSAHYGPSSSLPDSALDGFDLKFKRGLQTPTELEADIVRAVELATHHMLRRQAEYDDLLADLRLKHSVTVGEAEIYRRLALEHGEGDPVEDRLRRAGYRLRLVGSGAERASCEAFVVWMCDGATGVEVEVYGFPQLYAFGASEGAAIANLVELMQLYRESMEQCTGEDSVRAFLDRILGLS